MILQLLFAWLLQAQAADPLSLKKLPASAQGELLKKFPSLQKENFSPDMGDLIIRYLMSTGLYDRVEIIQNGEALEIQVENTKKMITLNFSGNQELSPADLQSLLQLNAGSRFDQEALIEGAERIRLAYHERGYLNTQVDILYPSNENGNVDVTLKITENSITQIQNIQFETPNKKIKTELESLVKKYRKEDYTEQNLKEFVEKLKEYFKDHDYVRAEVLDPHVSFNTDQTQVTLSYPIEKPEKYSFSFNGNIDYSGATLRDSLDIENFYSATADISAELASRIRKFYLNKGYARVQVEAKDYPKDEPFQRLVHFEIKEGPRIVIDRIEITGQFSQKSKYYINYLKENSGPLTEDMIYNKEEIEDGIKNLITFLKNEGHLRAQVNTYHAPYNRTKDRVTLTIQLDEGPQTILKNIKILGNKSFSQEELLKYIKLETNQPLKLNELETQLSSLKHYYQEKGFIEIEIKNEKEDLIQYNSTNTEADLNIEVREGPQVYVETIILDGNSFTKDYVILNELDFKTGQVLKLSTIEESKNRLQQLGLFNQVDIQMMEAHTEISHRTVVVKVSERDPGLFNMGMGVSNERELTLRGFIGLAYRNLGGTARAVSGRVDLNYNIADIKYLESKVTFGYLEPYLFNSRTKGRVNITREKSVTDYDNRQITEVNQTTWSLEEQFTSHFLGVWDVWSLATVKDFHLSPYDDEPYNLGSSLQNIATTGITFEWDYRDHPFNPVRGSLHRFNVEYGNPWLGSSDGIDFYKAGWQSTHYWNFKKPNWVWANSIRGGYLKNLSEEGGVPYDKKGFVLGGISTIRGFEAGTKERFPNDTDLGSDDFRLLTEAEYFLLKSEVRFPIYGALGGAIFYDGGSVLIQGIEFKDSYRDAAGFAIRYSTPVGPVDLEIGYKLDRKKDRGESPYRFHFSFGTF